jgi:hypothetical protein
MMIFKEIHKFEIYNNHNHCYHDDASYYQISKFNNPLCIYGIITRKDKIGEAFWIMDSFKDKVFCKNFFYDLFNHIFSLHYKDVYTWTRCKRLINIFGHFKDLGIEKVGCPEWDNDHTKTWFIKRL